MFKQLSMYINAVEILTDSLVIGLTHYYTHS